MNLMNVLTGNIDYIGLVKEYIEKIFVHEAKKYHCDPEDLKIVISRESGGVMKIMTYSNSENKIWRVIPDEEVQKILMK